jgi:hypothetical protein
MLLLRFRKLVFRARTWAALLLMVVLVALRATLLLILVSGMVPLVLNLRRVPLLMLTN